MANVEIAICIRRSVVQRERLLRDVKTSRIAGLCPTAEPSVHFGMTSSVAGTCPEAGVLSQ
jgi:hypothetical protein